MSMYTAQVPGDTHLDSSIPKYFEHFYAISDNPTAHEEYAAQFTPDATLVIASRRAQGTARNISAIPIHIPFSPFSLKPLIAISRNRRHAPWDVERDRKTGTSPGKDLSVRYRSDRSDAIRHSCVYVQGWAICGCGLGGKGAIDEGGGAVEDEFLSGVYGEPHFIHGHGDGRLRREIWADARKDTAAAAKAAK
jgi:hypothetical protein